jgi:hypothetical protein
MKIAIITPTYKRDELFLKTIESIFKDIKHELDYYVYFQGYSNEYITQICSQYPIKKLISSEGVGYVPATLALIDDVLNSGIDYDYIGYLDDDCIVVKNNLIEAFQDAGPDIGCITCRLGFNGMNGKKFTYTAATFYMVKADLFKSIRPELIHDLILRFENNVSIEILLSGQRIFVDHKTIVKHKVRNNTLIGNDEVYYEKSKLAAEQIAEKYKFCKVSKNGALRYYQYFKKLYGWS